MSEKNRKVSVIVPVYNVKDYLQKCVDSIINQTYQNLEIILVDDGSTDGSGKICDELKNIDNRIIVIHKANGGLSDARNAGLDISTGEYISFVDSDDYVDCDFIEVLVKTLEENNADISCCRYRNVWEDGKKEDVGNDGSLYIYKGTRALREYLYAKTIDPFACNKLYKSDLINREGFRFIKGILGEDNPFCIELFKKTSCVAVTGQSKYNYLQMRKGAITNSGVSQRKIDSVYYWDTVRIDCIQHYPELEKYALRREVLFYIGLYNNIYNSREYEEDAKKIRSFIKEHLKEIKKSDICERTVKISAAILSFNSFIYRVFMKMYKKAFGRAKL